MTSDVRFDGGLAMSVFFCAFFSAHICTLAEKSMNKLLTCVCVRLCLLELLYYGLYVCSTPVSECWMSCLHDIPCESWFRALGLALFRLVFTSFIMLHRCIMLRRQFPTLRHVFFSLSLFRHCDWGDRVMWHCEKRERSQWMRCETIQGEEGYAWVRRSAPKARQPFYSHGKTVSKICSAVKKTQS